MLVFGEADHMSIMGRGLADDSMRKLVVGRMEGCSISNEIL